MIETYLNENKGIKGTIFDGFPRTTAQAEAFDVMLKKMDDSVDMMIYMDVPE